MTTESTGKKIAIVLVFGLSALICLVVGGIQMSHYSNAAAINSDYFSIVTDLSYDSCSYPTYIKDPKITAAQEFDNAFRIFEDCGMD